MWSGHRVTQTHLGSVRLPFSAWIFAITLFHFFSSECLHHDGGTSNAVELMLNAMDFPGSLDHSVMACVIIFVAKQANPDIEPHPVVDELVFLLFR